MSARRVAVLTMLLFVACIVVDLLASDRRRAFGYLASDAYYYLDIARHVVHDGRFAFDGVHATNGFHPLWQLTLVPLAAVTDGHHLVVVVVLAGALAIAAALWLFGLALARDGRLTPLFALAPVGVYGLCAAGVWLHAFGAQATGADAAVEPMAGTLWSYVNGMESPLVLLAFAAAVWLYATRDVLARRRDAAWFGAALAAMTLARLDHVLIAAPCLVPLALAPRAQRANALVAAAAFAVPVAAWALVNRVAFGSLVPVSGGLKSTFPHVDGANLERAWACIAHLPRQGYWRLYRIEQLLIPMLAAIAWLVAAAWRRPARPLPRLLVPVAVGVLLLGGYDLLFVDLPLHGHWYVPVSTLFVSLAVFVAADRPWRVRLPATPLLVACTLLSLVGFIKLQRYTRANRAYADFYFDVAPRVRAHYGSATPRLLENDDGIVSFATGFPAMAGMGLALDPDGARAWVRGEIVPLAVARGFAHVTSMAYWHAAGLRPDSPDDEVMRFLLGHLSIPLPQRFAYRVDYVDGDFAILALTPK